LTVARRSEAQMHDSHVSEASNGQQEASIESGAMDPKEFNLAGCIRTHVRVRLGRKAHQTPTTRAWP
jgi:hypothetical protein